VTDVRDARHCKGMARLMMMLVVFAAERGCRRGQRRGAVLVVAQGTHGATMDRLALLARFAQEFIGLGRVDPVLTLDGTSAERRRVYLDTTATALMPEVVWRGLEEYLAAASANSGCWLCGSWQSIQPTSAVAWPVKRHSPSVVVWHSPQNWVSALMGMGSGG